MQTNGHWPDFLDLWLDYTASSQSPQPFRLWSGIALVASALERRVWAKTGKFTTYPNLYVMLVGSPGVGKQVIEEARLLFSKTKQPDSPKRAFHIASDSVTRASLIDELAKAKQTFLPPAGGGDAQTYHSLTLFSEEFRVLLPAYDQDFISRLDRIYNGPDQHSESRRTGVVRQLDIESPLLNILAGVQPAYLADTFPDNAWATGICRRLLMIFSAEGTDISAFDIPQELPHLEAGLQHHLHIMSQLWGQVKWEPDAAQIAYDFDMEIRRYMRGALAGAQLKWPIPNHSRLTHYVRSRTMMLVKLSMIAAIAARCESVIRVPDVQRALQWLLSAEELMPDIFRAMKGKSDREVMEELHRYVVALYGRDKGRPIRSAMLIDFLSQRLPSEKVDRVLQMAERADMIAQVAGAPGLWLPRPHSQGVE